MFDLEYNANVGFIPRFAIMRAAETAAECASEEEMRKTQEEVSALSESVAEQSSAVAENKEAVTENSAAIADNTAAIADEVTAREQAVEELNERINNIPALQREVVDELPKEGDPRIIYLVKDEGKDTYSEFVYVDGAWEKLGSEVDLSDYVPRDEFENAIGSKADISDVYSRAEADSIFLTEHQDISGLATKDELASEVAPLAKMSDVEGLIGQEASTREEGLDVLGETVNNISGAVEDLYYEFDSVGEKLAGLAIVNAEQDAAIALKADSAEVDSLIAAKEVEIYNLTKIVGDIGGAVTYEIPGENGKSFNTLMNNNGTVKLVDDVTTGRFGPGVTASNSVKLNLNGHDLNVTGLSISSSYAGILARGTQNIVIGGKGTIDAGEGQVLQVNGAGAVVTLSGSTTVYRNNRSGGELVYCYLGTVNITNGTFRNDGADKKFTLNCYDANYRNGTANIIVSSTSKTSGPKFYDFNPADNSAEGEHTNFVAEGCEVVTSVVVEDEVEHTVYTVVKSA